jgi:hypothetical protein
LTVLCMPHLLKKERRVDSREIALVGRYENTGLLLGRAHYITPSTTVNTSDRFKLRSESIYL